jgi:DoxX-like family
MKRNRIIYWTASVVVTIVLGGSGILSAIHAAPMMNALHHLGYPSYFVNILAVGKIIGLIIFLAPKMPRLKEWVYSGFTITVLSACYSHFSSGDGWLAAEPLVTFLALMFSYAYRPDDRRLIVAEISVSQSALASSR